MHLHEIFLINAAEEFGNSSSKSFFALAHSERRIVFTESLCNEAASRSKVAVVPPPKPMTISSAGAGLASLEDAAVEGAASGLGSAAGTSCGLAGAEWA